MKEKRTSIFMLLMLTSTLLAQVPPGISHQAVIRNAANELVINSPIGIKVSIVQNSAEGPVVYSETHFPTSNANGLISFVIGQGSVVNGTFEEIEWASGPFFLKTEVDPEGGAVYSISGISQLQSVPYALHAHTSADAFEGDMAGEPIINLADPAETQDAATKAYVDFLEPRVIEMENSVLQIYTLTLVVDPPGAGTVIGAGRYAAGEELLISATANPGFLFAAWRDENNLLVSSHVDFFYTIPAWNVTYTANFIVYDCPSTISDIDGNVYNTVLIGTQCWMKENLKTTHYRSGDPIDNPFWNEPWQINTSGAYAWYEHDIDWKDSYGALYNYYATVNTKGLCPEVGWHVARSEEFEDLKDYLGSWAVAGGKVKSTLTDPDPHPRWNSPNTDATNESNWSGLPGGMRRNDGSFFGMGKYGYFSAFGIMHPTNTLIALSYSGGSMHLLTFSNNYGRSVRCIKDTSIGSLNCSEATMTGTLTEGSIALNVFAEVPYTGGYGGWHMGQTLASTGVTGLTAYCHNWYFVVGAGILIYTITGTPIGHGIATFELDIGGQICELNVPVQPFECGTSGFTFIYNGSPVTYGTVLSAGRCWLDRNLGATQVATSSTDVASYGHLFQWGRLDDLHQTRTSVTYGALSGIDVPGHSRFILAPNSPWDWRSPQNYNLWQGVNGVNNPCPAGFRVPTEAEWNAEHSSWSTYNAAGAFASPLKLSVAGARSSNDGSIVNTNTHGYYWSSSASGIKSRLLYLNNTAVSVISWNRADGYSIRCIKD